MTGTAPAIKEQEWFTCDLSREELKTFMQRDNLHGALHVGLWFFLLGATGFLAYWILKTFGAAASVPAFLLYGIIYCACDARWHECSHGTVFRSPWLNEAVHFLATAMQQRDIVTTRWSHARHHSYTIINGVDPEITLTRPPNLLKALINYFNLEQGISYSRNTIIQSFGIPSKLAKEVVPEEDYPKVFFWSRMTLLLYAAVVAWALIARSWLPLLFFGLPRFYGGVIQWLFVVAEDDVLGVELNGRSYAIYRLKDKGVFATDGLCTHEQARLADGLVCDGCIACPKHNARFNICTGEALSRPAKEPLKTYPIKQQGDTLFIQIIDPATQPVNEGVPNDQT